MEVKIRSDRRDRERGKAGEVESKTGVHVDEMKDETEHM